MVTSVAVLSDIHGVLSVLDAVLAEPDVEAADLIVVTGDHAAGPMPVRSWTAWPGSVIGVGWCAATLTGNSSRSATGVVGACGITLGCRAARSDQLRLLAELPHPLYLHVDGFGSVAFCHGTPRDDEEVMLVDTRVERWPEVFAELDPEVRTVVCGTPTCRSSGWSTVDWSSIPAGSACRTADPVGLGAAARRSGVTAAHSD